MGVETGWVPTRAGAVFSALHGAVPSRGTAVVLVAPFGWEATTTARSLRAWARELAAAGYPAVRYHAPGSGDSEGAGVEQDLTTWTEALQDVLDHTRTASGCSRLAVVGLGSGGLVAASAVDRGAAVDDLVLWAVPGSGRLLLRQLRAFAAMTLAPEEEASPAEPLDDGVLWVHGYPMGRAAQEQLAALDLGRLKLARVERALVLGRGTLTPDTAVTAALSAAGAAVTTAPGEGYDRLVADTRYSVLPSDVVATVRDWLRPQEPQGPVAPWPTSDGPERSVVDPPAVGVVSERGDAPLTVVFMGTVATPRSGPNRMWTDSARAWAERGVPSLRLDLEGCGEADGSDSWPGVLESFYGTADRTQVRRSLDLAAAEGLPPRFVLVGLSSGAYWAAQAALVDRRVTAVCLLNPSALVWPPPLQRLGARGRVQHLTSRTTWDLLLHDPASRRDNLGRIGRTVGLRLAGLRGQTGDVPHGAPVTNRQALVALDRLGVAVTIALSPGEELLEVVDADAAGTATRVVRLAGPHGAHTLAPPVLRSAALDLVDETVEQALRS